jgi:hypothetical protein
MGDIAVIGSTNGVAGANPFTTIDAAIVTNIAVMYNFYDESLLTNSSNNLISNSENKVILNPYGVNPVDGSNCDANGVMTMSSFLNLFYATNAGYFNINPSNINNPAIILMSQTFTSSNSTGNRFSLYQMLLKAYCSNMGVTVNDIDPRIIMLLQKETFVAQSLATIKGTVIALSWDEVINSLLRSGVMDASGSAAAPKTSRVPLSLTLKYRSFVLDIDLDIRFTYLVDIQGYVLPTIPPAQPTYNAQYQVISN